MKRRERDTDAQTSRLPPPLLPHTAYKHWFICQSVHFIFFRRFLSVSISVFPFSFFMVLLLLFFLVVLPIIISIIVASARLGSFSAACRRYEEQVTRKCFLRFSPFCSQVDHMASLRLFSFLYLQRAYIILNFRLDVSLRGSSCFLKHLTTSAAERMEENESIDQRSTLTISTRS